MRSRSLLLSSALLSISLAAHATSMSSSSFVSEISTPTLTSTLPTTPIPDVVTSGSDFDLKSSFISAVPDTKAPTGPVVPEPSSFLLLGTGLVGLATRLRQRAR